MLDSELIYEYVQGQGIGSAGIACSFCQEKLEIVDVRRLKYQEY